MAAAFHSLKGFSPVLSMY